MKRRTARAHSIPRKDRVIIIVEGKETEKQYFNAIKQKSGKAITVKYEKNPSDMIAYAEREKAKNFKKSTDTVWFVLDGDNRSEDFFSKIKGYVTKQKTGHHLCISNISFEVWLLMHFKNSALHGSEKELETHLTSSLGYKYNKSKIRTDDFLTLTSTALGNAEHHNVALGVFPTNRGYTHVNHLVRHVL